MNLLLVKLLENGDIPPNASGRSANHDDDQHEFADMYVPGLLVSSRTVSTTYKY